MRRLAYLLKEAITNIRLNQTTTLIAIATTAFTLACFGVFLLLYLNLKGIAGSLESEIKVALYLNDGMSPQGVSDLQARLKAEPEVAAVSYVSKQQALADFRKQFPEEHRLLEGLGENPLPASFIVTMAPSFRSSDAVKRWAERHRSLPGVAQVQYSREWIENLAAIIGYLELAAVAIGGILGAASVTIIASTIRLTLYARRDEIEILRLIGATGPFIKVPYLVEGALLGAAGGILSLGVLKGGFEYFKMHLGTAGRLFSAGPGIGFLPDRISLLIVALGLVVGFAGSFVSLIEVGRTKP
jgi:cell division transport system permease protein